jgi:hypothetical protein
MPTSSLRLATVVGALALVAAACGSSNSHTAASSNTSAAPTTAAPAGPATTMAMMPLPAYTKDYKTTFASPTGGVKVTANELAVKVNAAGFSDSCDWAGKPVTQGFAHYHLLLDKALINMYCTPDATVSLQNVNPGVHKLEVVPALNDHAEVEENAQTMSFDYQPTSPLPALTDQTFAAKPSITILSPQPGAVLSGPFDVTVRIDNFKADCDLFGKPDLAGYGHWHVNMDSTSGPMMGMGTMLGMSCTTTLHTSTVGLKSGEKHTLIALLVDNGHAPLMPEVESKVDVTIG